MNLRALLSNRSRLIATASILFAALTPVQAQEVPSPGAAFGQCGDLRNAAGPFDFYSSAADAVQSLGIVETNHFNSNVENLVSGMTGSLISELDFVLRHFPNHPRGLWAMARYRLQQPWRPGERFYSAECYFARAHMFRPNDGTAWMIDGMYQARRNDFEAALERYARAEAIQPDSVELAYNAGLAHFAMKNYGKALELAQRAYGKGYPLPGLKNKLIGVGQWKEPPKPAATPKPAAPEGSDAGGQPAAQQSSGPAR